MKTKPIRQTVTFDAPPEKIFHLLMDEHELAAFTGAKAAIDPRVTGQFTLFDGYCHGYIIDLIQDRKIVQAWHFSEDGWPVEHFTICTFNIIPDGDKTKLQFHQSKVPEHKLELLKNGWKEFYWRPMKAYLNREMS
jgi:activator of HSP90 ATPase